jgi:hypothetical protein
VVTAGAMAAGTAAGTVGAMAAGTAAGGIEVGFSRADMIWPHKTVFWRARSTVRRRCSALQSTWPEE